MSKHSHKRATEEQDPPPESASASADQAANADPSDQPTDQVAEPQVDLSAHLAEQHDKYLRLAAEYDNYRRRTGKERSELYSRAQADLAKQLLDALDDLGRFAHVDPRTTDPNTIVQGVGMVEGKVLKALTGAGLEVINPADQPFDPTVHEAITTEPALSPEDDHMVARVYQQGYLFNGQLLRPARVVVKQWNG